ncbi:YihY/virulence factor BrkB family protein [Kineobactrum salinum]|uniref:YihY/virulence factor BrkB family protein n=1 Tax=Kineobactrum salinum TaxID=2708301 RepID=A0A6C0U3L1_9GAMM|nr:YihY/virulence factor BrkB family protein [Kineobactrum salinum]QIB64945.1 YihY/virulence factor BrkB family protein [Kineobactrum salinum]
MASRIFDKLPAPIRHWLGILGAASRNWLASQAFIYAAALAFFTVFSIAPIMVVVVTLVGLVLGESAAQGRIFEQLEGTLGPEAAGVVQTAVINSQIDQSGIWPALIGIFATVVGATTVFAQMQQSLNQIWDVAPRPSRSSMWVFLKARVLSLTIILAIGFVLLVSLLLSVALRGVMAYAEGWLPVPGWALVSLELSLSLFVVTLLFAAMFKILPDVVLSWRDVLLGAFLTAVLFTVGRSLIAMYLANTATASAYGAAGSLALLLLWVNYSSLILLFGAAFTRAHLEGRGLPVRPKSTAVVVHRELVEEVQQG